MLLVIVGLTTQVRASRSSSANAAGPLTAFLVELFPAKIRYSSMSLPYHIGNGWFGGGVPFIGNLIVAATGSPLSGLLYPMLISAIGVAVSLRWIREPTHKVKIWDEVGGGAPSLAAELR